MCDCGPHLEHNKIRLLPKTVGPGTMTELLQKTVQCIVDAAKETKQTFSILRTRQGDGEVLVRGMFKSFLLP